MLEVRVLGPLEVVSDAAVVRIDSPTQRLILTVLAAQRFPVSRDRLVDAVWGERPPRTAETTLAAYVSRLRRVIGSGHLERLSSGYVLRADWWDTDVFEALVREAATDEPVVAASRLQEALGLWRGSAFGEFADHLEVAAAVHRFEELRAASTERLAAALLRSGRAAVAVPFLDNLLSQEPLRESAWILLVRVLARAGRKADALEAARRCRRALSDVGLDAQAGLERPSRRPTTCGRPPTSTATSRVGARRATCPHR